MSLLIAGLPMPLPDGVKRLCRAVAAPWLGFTVVIYVFAFIGGFVRTWGRDYTPTLQHLITAFDLQSYKEVLTASVVNGRVGQKDLAEVKQPLLLRDRDMFYLALNKEVDKAAINGGVIGTNFTNNTVRCTLVNGWVLAFDKAGKFKWHTIDPVPNQMVVLEEFENMPVLLFSTRYNEILKQGGLGPNQRWVTCSI